MSLREWLVLIGIIMIAIVLIDGYRRMRLARKRANELSFILEDVKGENSEFSSELPKGGARSPYKNNKNVDNEKDNPIYDRQQNFRVEPSLSNKAHDAFENESENLDVLVGGNKNNANKAAIVPILTDIDQRFTDLSQRENIKNEDAGFMFKGHVEELGELDAEVASAFKDRMSKYKGKKTSRQEAKTTRTEKFNDRPPIKEVIVINVMAKGGQVFDGARVVESMLSSNMKFGDMSIFHRYAKDTGKILFSMANGVEPGIFNVDDVYGSSTPAVSFFMGLPGPDEPVKAFTKMVEVAKQLALDLGGELKDDQFSVMTQQTIEHCRQRIIDYERMQLTHRIST